MVNAELYRTSNIIDVKLQRKNVLCLHSEVEIRQSAEEAVQSHSWGGAVGNSLGWGSRGPAGAHPVHMFHRHRDCTRFFLEITESRSLSSLPPRLSDGDTQPVFLRLSHFLDSTCSPLQKLPCGQDLELRKPQSSWYVGLKVLGWRE